MKSVSEECGGSVVEGLTRNEGLQVRACLEALHFVLEQELLSTGSTQEDPSRHDRKKVEWNIKNQIRQTKLFGFLKQEQILNLVTCKFFMAFQGLTITFDFIVHCFSNKEFSMAI